MTQKFGVRKIMRLDSGCRALMQLVSLGDSLDEQVFCATTSELKRLQLVLKTLESLLFIKFRKLNFNIKFLSFSMTVLIVNDLFRR